MREIKFRGRRKNSTEWVYGAFLAIPRLCSYIYDVQPDGQSTRYLVDEDTVGQFTGLKDSSGREIYEGDIVECVTGRICKVYYFMSTSYCGFDLLPVGGFDCEPPKKSTLWKDLTVIGNVHDNPDLLTNGKE